MNRLRIGLAVALSTSMMIAGCSKDAGRNGITTPEILLPLLTAEPSSGRIGSVVAISCDSFKTITTSYVVGFTGAADLVYSDSASGTTVFATVPFGARSGPIAVYGDQLVGYTDNFTVSEHVDTAALAVAWYDIAPALTPKDSSVVDFMKIRRTWKAERRGETVDISRSHSVGEEFYEYHFVMIDKGAGQLPQFVSAWTYIKPDYPGNWTYTFREGLLKIQTFDTRGIICGRFFGKPLPGARMRNGSMSFWIDLRQ